MNANDTRPTLADLCATKGVTMTATLVSKPKDRNASGDDWKRSAYHFSIALHYQGRDLVTEYWMGHGNETLPKAIADDIRSCPRSVHAERMRNSFAIAPKPKVEDVLSSLILDGSACGMSFAEWCGEYGYDEDSRKALATYEECQKAGDKVRRLLGADLAEFQDAEQP